MYSNNFLRGNYLDDRESGLNTIDSTNINIDDFFNKVPNQNNDKNKLNLYNPMEGYEKGNIFSDLYYGYKNYTPMKLNPHNDQDKLFLDLRSNAFSAHELNLYLDLHPDDNTVLALFNDYRRRAKALIDEYENKYGPISITSDVLVNSPFLWEEMSWPWEGDNV